MQIIFWRFSWTELIIYLLKIEIVLGLSFYREYMIIIIEMGANEYTLEIFST